ncbi:MAG TPA: DNA-processing protein DprA [Oligoflexia bacterium]|nr:DNA-processing protein DprA [Oligoflexia bacterium]HMP49061.1 DNA-processing protein DprA [Oligoflexia bacterium]
MSKNRELDTLLHAWGLQSSFFSTRYCRTFRSFTEQVISREELESSLPLPEDSFWRASREEMERADELGVSCVNILDPEYPLRLKEIEDPPLVLFITGRNQWNENIFLDRLFFSIVGTRKMTPYGQSVTRKVARGLVEAGITVISGLAHGVDRTAHEHSLKADFSPSTIAVLGSGLLDIYPAINRPLAADILEGGGYLVSEYGLSAAPRAHHFPRRNRIVSGLSLGVLIVEAEEKSGSLITARLAMEQGREVFAVPGPIDAPSSQGCNRLLSEGASPMLSVSEFVDTLLEKYQRSGDLEIARKRREKKESKLVPEVIRINKVESDISLVPDSPSSLLISLLRDSPLCFDELLETGHFSDKELRALILELQMSDVIEEVSGIYRII